MTGTVHGTSAGHPLDVTTQRGREVERETETERRTTSSLSAAQTRGRAEEASLTTRLRAIDERDALARLVLTIRPDWAPLDVMRAIERDDRPWRTVVAGSIRAAADDDVKHPNGMRYLAPLGEPTPVPPSLDDWRNAERCKDHGAIQTQCALCRRGIGATQ